MQELKINGKIYNFKETIFEDDYLYEVNHTKGIIIITKYGVTLCFDNWKTLTSNITPIGLFPEQKLLTNSNLKKIITIWKSIGYEGKYYSKQESRMFCDV